jgi:pimeloyl-ACP methyl ester carboxylesterase
VTATSPTIREYQASPNKMVGAANGVDCAYRDVSEGTPPLVLLQHFRGNLDNWDPALIDALAVARRVVTFDNDGVGSSTGATPSTILQMARDAIEFLDGMDFGRVDLLGFSIGSFVAQEIALIRPAVVRRLILASSAPQGAAGMHGWAPEVISAVGGPTPNPDGYLRVRKPTIGQEDPRTPQRPGRGSRQGSDLANPAGAIRRSMHLGDPRSHQVAES